MRFSKPFIRFFVAVIFLISAVVAPAPTAKASEPEADHFSADAATLYQRASQVTSPPGADVILLEGEETLVFDAEGRVIRTRYLLYKTLTQKGAEEWASAISNWEPWHEQRPSLRARVIAPDGTAHLLDEKTITDAPAKESQDNVFSDRRVIRAPLPAVAPGSVVEEETVSRESAAYFGAGTVERFYFGSSVPVHHTHLVLDAPAALALRYDVRLLPDLKPERKETEGRVRVTFDYGPMDAIENSDAELPSDVAAQPSVTFSTGDSWQRVAEEYGKIVDQQLAGADLNSLVRKLIAGRKSRDDKAAAILQYLNREIRYTGVEFGESTLVPHSPSETLSRKYGDCKDKASLLVAMLRTANVSASMALLNAGSREDVSPNLPGLGMFDHAIVYVPGKPDLWIDVTDEYARLGEFPTMDQERLALVIRPGSEALKLTAGTASADNALVEKREIDLAENGLARIIETSQPHGSFESSYRRSYSDLQNKTLKDGLTQYVKSQYLAEKLDRVDRSDPNDLSRQFELVLESDHAKRGQTDLTSAVAAIRLEGLFGPLPSDLRQREKEDEKKDPSESGQKTKKKRTSDYLLLLAYVTEWDYAIVPPPGFRPKPLPANVQTSLGPCTFTEDFAADEKGVVHATLRFDTVKRRLTVSEATELRDKIVQLLGGEAILLYFEPMGEALASQGKVREALQSYRDLVALHPQEAVHHLQVAQTLLAAGLGEAARAEAQAAVKLEPTSALAQKTLAGILEYDSVGRKFRPGSDYAGAAAAFRAAEALDPEDKTIVGDLAILLEFNCWGLRYGPGAPLKEAIAEYRKLTPEKLAEIGVPNNIAYALFYAGEFSEARKYAETLNPLPKALIVACEAALHGSQSALAEGRKLTGGEEKFKPIAETAGDMLVRLRKYPLAADLEEAGANGERSSETAAYASLYRQTRPHEQMAFPDDPAGVAMHFLLLTQDPNLTVDQMRSIASRNGKIALSIPEVVEQLVKDERRSLSAKAREDEFEDVGIDLSLARAQPKAQGNDTTGYKILLYPSSTYKSSVYVVKEEGRYKVLAYSRRPAGVGLEVLDRIAANDLTGARALLDWLREDQHLEGGDDPLAGVPFPRFWTRGRDADTGAMKRATAAFLIWYKPTTAQGVAILEEAAKDPSIHEAEKVNILLALLRGYGALDDPAKELPVTQELASQYPESKWAFFAQSYCLRATGQFDEADRLAEDRLKRIPDDVDAMRAQVMNAIFRGDYGKAHVIQQSIIDDGNSETEDLNVIAWYALFTGKVDSTDLANVLKATQLNNSSAAILHTLGCTFAELGKTKEAHEVLIHAMDLLNLDQPNDDYWYAFGRIAEQYGERDVALADYARVAKPKRAVEIPDSSYRLAQIRLKSLRGEK